MSELEMDLRLARQGDYPGASGVKRMADTISALRAEVERLREALEPFVRHGRALGVFDGDPGPHWIMTDKGHRDVPALDFMRARAALTQTKDTTDDA